MRGRRVKAIPTIYKSIRFRSRLEAKWAAFFDLAGWRWEYEPEDLDGWIPDFAIIGRDSVTLVEVKPIYWPAGQWPEAAMRGVDRDMIDKPLRHTKRETLILGTSLPPNGSNYVFGVPLGLIANEPWDQGYNRLDGACLFQGNGRPLDFAANYGWYKYRVGGEYDGDGHLHAVNAGKVNALWAEASNTVQWQPPNKPSMTSAETEAAVQKLYQPRRRY